VLIHPIVDKLVALRLTGMAKAFEEQLAMADAASLTIEDRIGLMVEREETTRSSRRLTTRLRAAGLRQSACVEDLDFRHPRRLDRGLLLELASCRWIAQHHNVLVTGKTGLGKTYIACALAHKACLEGYRAQYARLPKLLRELAAAKGDGRYERLISSLARIDLLVLDDWGLTPLADDERHDLYEIVENRNGLRSTLVASQLPVKAWHQALGDPTLADGILDRLTSNAYRLELEGDTMRPRRGGASRPGSVEGQP
jgi:DNA replication protein DnaC